MGNQLIAGIGIGIGYRTTPRDETLTVLLTIRNDLARIFCIGIVSLRKKDNRSALKAFFTSGIFES